jgi:hypothetical protein
MKRWSKLQKEIYNLLDDKIDIQIHCRKYRMPASWSTDPHIPRYWITLGKEIIFDFPKMGSIQDKHQLYIHIPTISDTIREYIDTDPRILVKKVFINDKFGITDIFKAADRRLGTRSWERLPQTEAVTKVLEARRNVRRQQRQTQ